MKNTRLGLMAIAAVTAGLFAFTNFEGGSIKGKIIPADGASQVWALSPKDTLKAIINQGIFEFQNANPGTYKVYIDAVEPYKDVIKEGVQVTEGGSADLGEISLQK
ncbi:MAG: carboxypeptidase regulatory-like domain-containing protein [Panacibacter sp.]